MATRRKSEAKAKFVRPYRLLSSEIPNVPGMCLWQHEASGQHVLMEDGSDPNESDPVAVRLEPAAVQPAEPTEETAVDRIAEMLIRGREQEQARVKVTEIQDDGTRAHCADYTPEEFERGGTLTLIRKRWGPGKYVVELFGRNQISGRFSCYGRDTVVIKPEREPDASESVTGQLQGLRDDLLKALTGRQDKSETDKLRETLGLMTMMREAMGLGSAGSGRQPNLVELVGQLVAAMKGARELAREVNPSEEPQSLLEKLAPQALDIVKNAMAHQALNPVQLPPTLAATPANGEARAGVRQTAAPGVTPSAVAAPTNGASSVDAEELAGFKVAIATLNGLALFRMDPAAAADMIFEKLPDEALPLLKLPDWFDRLAQIDPSCMRHRDWYVRTQAALLKLFEEGAALPPDNQPATPPAAA
jgi:hypothetical protein